MLKKKKYKVKANNCREVRARSWRFSAGIISQSYALPLEVIAERVGAHPHPPQARSDDEVWDSKWRGRDAFWEGVNGRLVIMNRSKRELKGAAFARSRTGLYPVGIPKGDETRLINVASAIWE